MNAMLWHPLTDKSEKKRQADRGQGDWMEKKDIYECPYIYLGEVNWGKKISGFLKAKFLHQKYSKSF